MDKLKELIKQLGGSPELVEQFTKELQGFKDRCTNEANQTLQTRLETAKQVCLEEFSKEKAELSRKVEIFLEAKVASINREAQKQAAIGESQTVKTLKDVKRLIEGVAIDGTSGDSQAAVAENKKLRVTVATLQEQAEGYKTAAKRANVIAAKVLQRNRILESKGSARPAVATESKEPQAKKELESLRTESAEPKTTRPVLAESQTPAKPKPQGGNTDVMAIAEGIDDSAPVL